MKKDKGIVTIFLILTFIGMVCVIIAKRASNANEKAEDRFLELVSTYFPGYESFDFNRLDNLVDNTSGSRPEDPENIVLLLKKGDKWQAHSLSGLSLKKIKSKEDLDKIDVFVFGISQKRSSSYRKYINGSPAGTVDVETERIDLYYFDSASNGFFLSDVMPYKTLPKNVKNTTAYTYKLPDVKRTIEKDLQVKFAIPLWSKILLGVLFTAVIGIIVAVVAEKINNRKKYR